MNDLDLDNQFFRDWEYSLNVPTIAYTFREFRDFIRCLDDQELLGPIRLDLGCGWNPVSSALVSRHPTIERNEFTDAAFEVGRSLTQQYSPSQRRSRILLDYIHDVHKLQGSDDPVTVCVNLREFFIEHTIYEERYKKALLAAEQQTQTTGLDVILAASILNYIPFEKVFSYLDRDLNDNGLVIVSNQLGLGHRELFHIGAPKNEADILRFFCDKDKGGLGYSQILTKSCGAEVYSVFQKRA